MIETDQDRYFANVAAAKQQSAEVTDLCVTISAINGDLVVRRIRQGHQLSVGLKMVGPDALLLTPESARQLVAALRLALGETATGGGSG